MENLSLCILELVENMSYYCVLRTLLKRGWGHLKTQQIDVKVAGTLLFESCMYNDRETWMSKYAVIDE